MIKTTYLNYLIRSDLGLMVSLPHKTPALCDHVVDIVPAGSKPEMVRPDAESAVACVKNEEPVGNFPKVDHPRDSVCPKRNRTVGHLTVSVVPEYRTSPEPTAIGLFEYPLPEALNELFGKELRSRVNGIIVDLHSSICAFGLLARRAFLI